MTESAPGRSRNSEADTVPQDPSDPVTSIVVPAYNEVDNVGPLVEEIRDVFETPAMEPYLPAEIVVVDDGSSDGTREELRRIADEVPGVTAVFLSRNFGQTQALAAGIDTAVGQFIVTMDADRQNNPADVPRLLDRLTDGYDCVSGWRKERRDPLGKRVPSAIQTYLARFTGPDIHDFGCTLTAYRAAALRDIDLYGEGHRYIPAKLYKRGHRITELPVDHRPRTEGETKYGAKRLVKGFLDLLFHVFWNRFSTRPLHFLGASGILLLAVGFLIGAHAVVVKFVFGVELLPRTPRLILTASLILFGLQLLMFGFLAEILTKIYYSNDSPYRIDTVHGERDR